MQLNSTQWGFECTSNFIEFCTYHLWHQRERKKAGRPAEEDHVTPVLAQCDEACSLRMSKSSRMAQSRCILFQISVWTRPKWRRVSRRPQSSPKRWGIIHSDISPFSLAASIGKVSSCPKLPDGILIFHALINARLWRYMIPISVAAIDGCSDVYLHAHDAGPELHCAQALLMPVCTSFTWGTLATS